MRNELESKLGLNVEIINKKNNSGKIVIKYKTLDQFELISKLHLGSRVGHFKNFHQ